MKQLTKKQKEKTHFEEMLKRLKLALQSPSNQSPSNQEGFLEILIIENVQQGLNISLQSTKLNLNEMFNLSKEIKKHFFIKEEGDKKTSYLG